MKKYPVILAALLLLLVISSCGDNPVQPEDNNTTSTQSKASGADIYNSRCISCHQATGEGMGSVYPPLAKSDYLADKGKTISAVVNGLSGDITVNGKTFSSAMPAQPLNDEEAAAVLNYVYSNWQNNGTVITGAEVKASRK